MIIRNFKDYMDWDCDTEVGIILESAVPDIIPNILLRSEFSNKFVPCPDLNTFKKFLEELIDMKVFEAYILPNTKITEALYG